MTNVINSSMIYYFLFSFLFLISILFIMFFSFSIFFSFNIDNLKENNLKLEGQKAEILQQYLSKKQNMDMDKQLVVVDRRHIQYVLASTLSDNNSLAMK